MLNTPPGWLTKVGDGVPEVRTKISRSSPPSVTVPALSQRRSSPMAKLPPAVLRSMLLLELAGVSRMPDPSRSALEPFAVNAPVTATVPLPPSTGPAPASVRSVKVVVTGELMFRTAAFTVRLDGTVMAEKVDARLSVPPVRLIDGTLTAPPAARLAVPADTDRLGTLSVPPALRLTVPVLLLVRAATSRLPPAWMASEAPAVTVVGSTVVVASLLVTVTLVVTPDTPTVIAAPPAGTLARVRMPPNPMAVPGPMA